MLRFRSVLRPPHRPAAGEPRSSPPSSPGRTLLPDRLRRPLLLTLTALLSASIGGLGASSPPLRVLLTEPSLTTSISADGSDPRGSISEGQRANPIDFTAEELRELQRRFGVHGPQPALAQLLTEGLDQLEPLRAHTLTRLEELRPVILRESRRQRVNPMLVTAVLFDEMQHAKPGEDHPIAAHSGLFSTLGPAQLGLGEMVHQGLLSPEAGPEELQAAREELLDPERNVALLVGKFARLQRELQLRQPLPPIASRSPREAKALATLAYLHNGKLDYPSRVLRYMQDPALHAILYGNRREQLSPLI